MKIALVTNHIGISGVNNVVKDMAMEFISHGHECTIFYFKDSDDQTEFPCRVVKADSWKGCINYTGYDVVHCHGLWPMLNIRVNGLRVSKGKKPLLVTTLHCYCYQDLPDLYGKMKGTLMCWLYLWCAKKFDKIVCLSKDMMLYYKKWLPKTKLTYSYNTRSLTDENLSEKEKKEILEFRKDGKIIGMNGVLIFRKGIDLMLQALRLMPEEYKLFVVGDGKERDTFQKMAGEFSLKNRVHFSGFHNDAARYLPYYDILTLPSRSEGFPLSLLEAAAYGKKVVVSDLPIVRECFVDHLEVEMFRLVDGPSALAYAILRATENKGMGEHLRERFEKDYSPQRFYDRYMEIYTSSFFNEANNE